MLLFNSLKTEKPDLNVQISIDETDLTVLEPEQFANDLMHIYTAELYRAVVKTKLNGERATNLIYYRWLHRGFIILNSKIYNVGCNHNFKELSAKECKDLNIPHLGNCWHVYKCTNCNHIESYDSSD